VAGRGPRGKFTPERREWIRSLLAAGVPVQFMLGDAGISETTYNRWLEEGEAAQEALDTAQREGRRYREPAVLRDKREFRESVIKAEAASVAVRVARLERAGRGGFTTMERKVVRKPEVIVGKDGKAQVVHTEGITEITRTAMPDPRVDEWFLERRYPEHFARREKVEPAAPQADYESFDLSDPETRELIRKLRPKLHRAPSPDPDGSDRD
jgi:hypothetical protein